MRIIEAQNAVLTNFEVTEFLEDRKAKNFQENPPHIPPKQLEDFLNSVKTTLTETPLPLSQQPTQYNENAIRDIIVRLEPFKLTKAEVIMLINVRPQSQSTLHCCIQEIGSRLQEEDQEAILDIINETLGNFPPKEEEGDDQGDAGPAVQTNGTS